VRVEQSDVRSLFKVLWRWKLLIIAFVVIIPSAVFVYVSGKPKVYESSTLLQVQALAVDTSLFGTAGRPRSRRRCCPRPAW
jgi:uncharacterized protein involved in exopolysaccharide biosynthesis